MRINYLLSFKLKSIFFNVLKALLIFVFFVFFSYKVYADSSYISKGSGIPSEVLLNTFNTVDEGTSKNIDSSKEGDISNAAEVSKESIATKVEDDTVNKKEDEVSDEEEKRDIILYGLGDEVINLIKQLQDDEDTRFDGELKLLLAQTKIPSLRAVLISYFSVQKNDTISSEVLNIIENRDEYAKDTVTAAISYACSVELKEVLVHLHSILEDENKLYYEAAISAIGKLGTEDDAVFLSELYEGCGLENEKESLIFKQNIMASLIFLASPKIWDFLQERAEDEEENAIIRSRAITALGKTGDEKAIPILTNLFEAKEPIIREACVKGLSGFKNESVQKTLDEAFKDSYYKVRLQAVVSAKEEKNEKAIPFILYRAKKDSESIVRIAAIEALSFFNDEKANKWLTQTFSNDKTEESIRLKIAEYLLKNNFTLVFPFVEERALKLLSDKKKYKDAAELGKVISLIENELTVSVAKEYIKHKEVMLKSIGLDMFKKNKYPSLVPLVTEIASDEKNGALSRRAKALLSMAESGNKLEAQSETPPNVEVSK